MADIKITEISDDCDCETCGSSWAEGYEVTIGGYPFGNYTPLASCFGGNSYELSDVLKDLIKHFGHELEIE